MEDEDKHITAQQIGALGVGLIVTVASSLLTGLVSPVFFPFNILISLGLGTAAGYGTLKVLDPRSKDDLLEAQTDAQYRQMLKDISEIAIRTGEASQSLLLYSPETSERLGNIARMTEMIRARYQEPRHDFSGASATLLILHKFEGVLAHYLKVKRGELFMDKDQRSKEIAETEMHVIPRVENALESLGKKLDAGETLDKGITKGTLESMLRSLNLIETASDQIGSAFEKGDSR